MVGKLKDLYRGRDGGWVVSIATPFDLRELFDELGDAEIDFEIKKHRRSRSLDANSMCWVIINQIAEKLRLSPEEVYQEAIRNVGGVSGIVGVKDCFVDAYCRAWESKGIGFQAEVLPTTGKEGWSNVRVWLGSSQYDTKQMSDLISGLITEAESLGIATITPKEEARLLEKWAKKKEGGKQNENDGGKDHAGAGKEVLAC